MITRQNAVSVFFSYAHADEPLLQQLKNHLSLLNHQGLISTWDDRDILPGTNWTGIIDERLKQASIILLLVSSDFLASNYCYEVEMQCALERYQAGAAQVIPIIMRPVDWQNAPFAHLNALPTDARAITTWSNPDEAFMDVVSGIRRAIENLSLLPASPSRAALPPIWNIPYPRNTFFMGRDDLLVKLHTQLQTGQATALSQSPTAISGLGGIGKTQIATEYAYRYHQDYQAILWARAENQDALISSYTAIATLLQLPERDAKEQEITIEAVKAWLQAHQQWLLILDNADDLDILPPFLPPAPGGHILLTTRAWDMQRLATRLEVETLSDTKGALLLLRRAGLLPPDADLSHASIEDRQLATLLTHELGGLPLALDQAGAYLEATSISLQEYHDIYQTHRQALLHERRSRIPDHPAAVATTWSLSFERVQAKNPAAADLLRLCAYMAPDAIAEEILTADVSVLGPVLAPVISDALQRNQAIEALLTYSLIRRDPTEKTLSIHRLVQAVLQDNLDATQQRTWAERAMLAISAAFPHPEHSTWSQCERLLLQTLTGTQIIQQYQITTWEATHLLHESASYLQDRARYSEAQPLFLRALHIWEQSLGPDHPQVASPLNGLAILYHQQGKYTEAEPLFLRALHIQEQSMGPDHPQVASPLNNLAILYDQQGQYTKAEPLFLRALHIWEQSMGPDHPDVAYPLNNLAELYREQGHYTEAEPLFLRALHIWEQSMGPDHPDVAYPLNNLAELYREQGHYTEAEPLFLRALHIREQSMGPDHPQVAYPLNGLAELYREQGHYTEAEPLFLRALRIWEQSMGPDHPDVASPLNGLAELYREQGQYTKAEPLFLRALHINEQSLGPDHPDVAYPLNNLAILYHQQGQYTKAEPLFLRALHIWEQSLGPNHPHTRKVRTNYAILLRKMGRDAEANKLEEGPDTISE